MDRLKRAVNALKAGRIPCGDKPKIDPVRMIQLIQTRPKEHKLDGGNKLRFFAPLEIRLPM